MAYEFVEIGEASAPSQPLTPDEALRLTASTQWSNGG